MWENQVKESSGLVELREAEQDRDDSRKLTTVHVGTIIMMNSNDKLPNTFWFVLIYVLYKLTLIMF